MHNKDNIKSVGQREKDHKNRDYLLHFCDRLKASLKDLSQNELAKRWGFSSMAVGCYINGKQYPRVHDLVKFAQITDTDLIWLMTGHHYSQTDWLSPEQSVVVCPDNSMAPTLNAHTPVIIEPLTTDWPVPDGVYCLSSAQGPIFRRLQWHEDKQGFWLRCDNPLFELTFTPMPAIIGRVTHALSSVI